MQKNATTAGALLQIPLESLQRFPDFLAGFKGRGWRKWIKGEGKKRRDKRK